MADQLLAHVQDMVEGQIDFQGQKKAENFSNYILIAFGAFAFVVGYIQENVHLTLWLGLLGAAIAFLIVVPPWPFYNEDPEKWLNSGSRQIAGTTLQGLR